MNLPFEFLEGSQFGRDEQATDKTIDETGGEAEDGDEHEDQSDVAMIIIVMVVMIRRGNPADRSETGDGDEDLADEMGESETSLTTLARHVAGDHEEDGVVYFGGEETMMMMMIRLMGGDGDESVMGRGLFLVGFLELVGFGGGGKGKGSLDGEMIAQ